MKISLKLISPLEVMKIRVKTRSKSGQLATKSAYKIISAINEDSSTTQLN